MNSKDVLDALLASRSYKPETKEVVVPHVAPRNETSFVSMYDQLDQLDVNPFNRK